VDKVLNDVRNGFVSVEKARDDYGVEIDPVTLRLKNEETTKLRGQPEK
jgi:N-methylhydantoinase B